jgi:hypothetical protein
MKFLIDCPAVFGPEHRKIIEYGFEGWDESIEPLIVAYNGGVKARSSTKLVFGCWLIVEREAAVLCPPRSTFAHCSFFGPYVWRISSA